MADTIKNEVSLNVGLEYYDTAKGTDKILYIKLPNPKSTLNETSIRAAMDTFINAQIVKDPFNNPFSTTSVSTAYKLTEQKITLDVGWQG